MSKEEKNFYHKFKSPIPPHLSEEELEIWLEEELWLNQEKERRKKDGRYDQKPKKKQIGWKTIKNLFRKDKKW
tara:strand:- start:1322 stop:1540 length:219 start_codon:yes stop_codon:yes gene_type:complete